MKVCIFSSFMKMSWFIFFNILKEKDVESQSWFPIVVVVVIWNILFEKLGCVVCVWLTKSENIVH